MKAIDQDGISQEPTRYSTLAYFTDYYNFQGVIRPKWDDVIADTTPPTVSNMRIASINSDTITLNADLSDNVGVTRVWLNVYGPSGNKGYTVSASNGSFSHTINTADYGGAGTYSIHLYAFDAAGNETRSALDNFSKETLLPKNIWIKADKTEIVVGDTITFTYGIDNATKKGVGIDKDGVRYASLDGAGKTSLSYNFTEEGTYCVITEGSNSIGYACCHGIWISVLSEEDYPYKYTLSFNSNGSNETYSSKTITRHSAYGELPVPIRENYTFKGWFTSASGGIQITSDTIVTVTEDITLYAQWEKAEPYIEATVKNSGNSKSIEVVLNNINSYCDVIVAGYKGGCLVAVDCVPYENQAIITLEGDIDEIKVMVWDGLSAMEPLCDAEVIPSSEWKTQ